MLLIVGSYASPEETGIHLFRFDEASELFVSVTGVSGVENPSYLTVSDDNNTVYSVSEYKSGDFGKLSAFSLGGGESELTLAEQVTYAGVGSCLVSVDKFGRHAFIANYGSGTLVVLKLRERDKMAVCQTLEFDGSRPDSERQEKPHIHSAILSPDQRTLYCADLGADRLYRFTYDPSAEEPLRPLAVPEIMLPPGSGPRHLAFTPDSRWLYLITELRGEIFAFAADEGRTSWCQQVSVLADGYTGKIEAADIQVHPNGKYLYASHRGDSNEIIVFKIKPETGRLTFIQRISAEGLSPRNLLVWEQGGMLLVANEQSDNVSIFTISADGKLNYSNKQISIKAPACLKMIDKH